MNIKRIKYSVVFFVMFFSCVNLAYASDVVINEFVSHPNSGEQEWVELRNTTGSPINLNGWKLTELSSPNTNPTEKDLIILSGTINDILIFDVGTTKLNDGGDSIGLYDEGNEIDRVTYGTDSTVKNYSINLSTPAIGKSGSLVSGSWVTNQEPTKSILNSDSDSDNDSDNNTSINSSSSSTSSTPKEIPVIYKMSTKIITPKIVTAGVPFTIDHNTTGLNKEKIILGKFVWNFGDGMQKQLSVSDPFNYIYDYPGEYVITLSYYDSIFDTNPDVADRLTIKVIPSGIIISSVGTYTDPFIEIENNSSYEMSLYGWIVRGNIHSFTIPEGMIILPNKKLKLSPKITGFDFNDLNSISIIDTGGQVFATYPKQKTYSTKNYNSTSQGNIIKADIVGSDKVADIANSPDIINLNDLGASAGNVDNKLNNKTLVYSGLAGIIAIGLLSIFLVRRKDEIPDYVEKGISASDMTIIE